MDNTLERALANVRAQKASVARERDALNAKFAQLQAAEIGLQNALGQQIQAEIAWTNLVRTVIYSCARQQPMSAVQVRDTLQSWGYNFTGIQNPLAFINTCLQRLAEQGQVARTEIGRPYRFSCSE
jgi:hypothetical protein